LQSTKSDIIKQAIEYFIQVQEENKLQKAVKLMAKEDEILELCKRALNVVFE